jgi:hypothetical protein
MVLTEEEALEVLAYLVTAARTQVDEAAEYGPLRLITAAGRLADFVAPRASPGLRELLTGPLSEMPTTATRSNDPEYAAKLDAVCGALADYLVDRNRPR